VNHRAHTGQCAALALLFAFCAVGAAAQEQKFATVVPGYRMTFPRDHGSHPDFRTEWWYITGQVKTQQGQPLGFQITFFRSATGIGAASQSAFAPSQIVFAHAAVSDAGLGKLRHDQKAARAMTGIAKTAADDTDVQLENWTLKHANGRYRAVIPARDFRLDLDIAASGAPLLQGKEGFSQKGPETRSASYYYSRPQLKVSGKIELNGKPLDVTGTAWLDHEWSSEYLMPGAQGWDWVGLNLDDGGALMAFRIRDAAGKSVWAAGTLQAPNGTAKHFGATEVAFEGLSTWTSPRTKAVYPVKMNVRLGAETWQVDATMPDQELDSRQSTGAVYWEGAVAVSKEGKRVGAGYLELTGYADKLKF
jgi:predicted secreted hydrolase